MKRSPPRPPSWRQIFLGLLLVVPRPTFADLGDTLEQSALKYGAPSPTGDEHILEYVHGPWRIWQSYVHDVCAIAEFRRADRGPLTPADCQKLDSANLPGLVPGGPGWVQVQWPDSSIDRETVSLQYEGQTRYQVIAGQSRDTEGGYYYRMFLSDAGIELIKSLGGR
jgi:hypothetical protein